MVEGLAVAEQRFKANGTKQYTLRYLYDESNSPVGFGIRYATSSSYWQYYYFGKNIQGDVIALYRSDYNSSSQSYYPTLVATYSYDPWGTPTGIYDANGNAISQTAYNVAAYNPFRYRGYRYDGDTRLYYLQSRYYDPAIGRFINADGYVSTGQGYLGCNMFTYCGNNPLNHTDTTESSWKDAKSAFKKASAAASRIIKANFGAGSTTTVTIAKKEVVYIPDPFPITAKAGTKITKTISTVGSSKKTFSVYMPIVMQHIQLNLRQLALKLMCRIFPWMLAWDSIMREFRDHG